jgi:hypothetical protein
MKDLVVKPYQGIPLLGLSMCVLTSTIKSFKRGLGNHKNYRKGCWQFKGIVSRDFGVLFLCQQLSYITYK